MVLGIPASKLTAEVFKAVTKPVVNAIKRNVRKSPFWKDRMLIPMAQGYNLASVRVRLWAQGISRNKEQVERSAKMSEEAALELGAEIVANFLTFVVGLMAIILQQSIASATEKNNEEHGSETQKIEAIVELKEKVFVMSLNVEKLESKLDELNRTVLLMKTYNKSFIHENQK